VVHARLQLSRDPLGGPERWNQIVERVHLVLYVRDQAVSTQFYSRVLAQEPTLNVPNMTEFALPGGAVLGLMPEAAIKRLLGAALPDPTAARPASRAELYLLVGDPSAYHERALGAGARELSPLLSRDWGHRAAYSLDPDNHVLAFAHPIELR
jgi:catechol 2,3-dioxygenase-like lactoylglutathione lyase family enzyme